MIYRLKKIILLSILISFYSVALHGVEPTWEVNVGSVFDNREGDANMNDAKTFFFVTLAPEIGLKLNSSDRISGGAVWTQPLENGVRNGKILPVLYYRRESDSWSFSMGMFPRTQLRAPLPGFMWNDSLAYFQRNIRGALVQYSHRKGYFDAYIDWRGMQSETTREAFNIVFHGEIYPAGKPFLIGGNFMMNHLARRKESPEHEKVVDNFMANPYVGVDYSRKTVLDSLVVKVGGVLSLERNRADLIGWRVPGGIWCDVLAELKFIGFRNSLYVGGKLFPEYSLLGTTLYQGESYYRSPFYNRTDIYARIIKNKYVNLEAQLNFNFAKNNFIFYQRLLLEVHVGNITGKIRRSGQYDR